MHPTMNKINKQILAGLLLVVALFATSSCQKEQSPTFKQTSSERMLNLIEECRNTLLANPNGWEMKYVTPVQLNNKGDQSIASTYKCSLPRISR